VEHLTDEERRRIDRQGWGDSLGAAPYVRIGKSIVLNKRDNGACVFLDEKTKRCRIHERFGERAKPAACRIYPFFVRDVPQGWQVSWRFDCPGIAASRGAPMSDYLPLLNELTRTLGHEGATGDDCPQIVPGIRATEDETRMIIDRLVGWFEDRSQTMRHRMIGAASLTATLSQADYTNVREDRMAELVGLLLEAVRCDDHQSQDDPPSPTQRGLLRELAFAHAEHVTIADMNAGFFQRTTRKLSQVRAARRFRLGVGAVPAIPGFDGGVDFTAVERVQPMCSDKDTKSVESLIIRFVCQRLKARSVFGYGYYGWPMFLGLMAFWVSIAAAGWLARVHAATAGRSSLIYEDVFEGLRIADRSAGRSPTLGTRAERLRLKYLADDDGLIKLLHHYALV